MNSTRLAEDAYLVEMPPKLDDPDEKPYVDACPAPQRRRSGFILLDFHKMHQINGLGASMLAKLGALASRKGQRLLALGMSDHHRRVFGLTGLSHALVLCRDIGEAFDISRLPGLDAVSVPSPATPSDTTFWAVQTDGIIMPRMPAEAINMNMKGRKIVGPVDGFGALWQKKYRIALDKNDLTPEDVIRTLKENFPRFQPSYNRFYPSAKGIIPGEPVAIDSSTPGGPVSTGVIVLYADESSFTFITPQGHPESGWVTFSASRIGGQLTAQILGLARANDPVYEVAFRAIGSKMQIRIWTHVLESLARYLQVPARAAVEPTCVDSRVRWSQSGNVWYNAQIRTILAAPAWWPGKRLAHSRKGRTSRDAS